MKKTVFFLRGLPGTGKTTLSNTIRKHGSHLCVKTVSRDVIREQIRQERALPRWEFSAENEAVVSELFHDALCSVLADQETQWIIIDNTNLSFDRVIDLEVCLHQIDRDVSTPNTYKIVVLQLGGWMSKMRQCPQLSAEREEKMRKEMGDAGMAYFKHCEKTPNWWFFMCKSWSDVTLCSGCVPFDWKWKVPMLGGWTKATTDILCNFFDPTLTHKHEDFGGIFFNNFSKVFSTYFCDDFEGKE